MKHHRLTIQLLTSAIFSLLMFATSFAFADEIPFHLTCGQNTGDAVIMPQNMANSPVLYLPGGWLEKEIHIHPSWEEGVVIDGELYQNGDCLPSFSNKQQIHVQKPGQRSSTKIVVYTGSKIPALFLSVAPADLNAIHKDKQIKVPSTLTAYRADGSIELAADVEALKTRGNTTHKYPKMPYQIKLEDKHPLFGMDKAKKFILLADYLDISLLRNRITLDMAKASGMQFALDCVHTDLYINGEYRGLYLLTEKIEIKDSSVDIRDLQEATENENSASLETYPRYDGDSEGLLNARWYEIPNDPVDITGGYLLETDKTHRYKKESDAGFITAHSMAVYIKEPEYPSEAQVKYISSHVNAFHRALNAKDGIDPQTGKHYSELIDVDSFVIKYLIEEISKNFDGLNGSQYFYKDGGDDLLHAGPAWDYDLSYGNIRQEAFARHSMGRYFYLSAYKGKQYWYNGLFNNHAEFQKKVIEKYRSTFQPLLEVLNGLRDEAGYAPVKSLESYQMEIQLSAEMNFKRWDPYSIKDYYKGAGKNFNAGVTYLNRFIELRRQFLDSEWGAR